MKHFVGYGPQERDHDNEPELPRVPRAMVFRHFGSDAGHPLLRTEWKDGIDIELPTYALQCFAEDYTRMVLATPTAASTAEPAEEELQTLRIGDRTYSVHAEVVIEIEKLCAKVTGSRGAAFEQCARAAETVTIRPYETALEISRRIAATIRMLGSNYDQT